MMTSATNTNEYSAQCNRWTRPGQKKNRSTSGIFARRARHRSAAASRRRNPMHEIYTYLLLPGGMFVQRRALNSARADVRPESKDVRSVTAAASALATVGGQMRR